MNTQKAGLSQHISIWSKEYKLVQNRLQDTCQEKKLTDWYTVNSEAILQTNRLRRPIFVKQQDNSGMKFTFTLL